MRKLYFLLMLFQGIFAMENRQNKIQDEEMEMIDTSSKPKNNGAMDPQINVENQILGDEKLAKQMFYEMLDTNPKSESLMDQLNGYGLSSNDNLNNQIFENQLENENLQNQFFESERLNCESTKSNENLINQNPKANDDSITRPQANKKYYNQFYCCKIFFENMFFPEMYYNETITAKTILDYELADIKRKLDTTICEQSDQSLKKKIKELKWYAQQYYENLKTNLIKAASENRRFTIDPNNTLSVSEINPVLDFPVIQIINQTQGKIFQSVPFINKLETNNERRIMFNLFEKETECSYILDELTFKELEKDWKAKKAMKHQDNKLHINSTINSNFIEENFRWEQFSLFKISTIYFIEKYKEKGVEFSFVPNEAKFIMESLQKYDHPIIKSVNDFVQTAPKELFFLLNWSNKTLNKISPQFHFYFSVLNQIYSNPLLCKTFFTIFKLSEIEYGKQSFQWRQSYGNSFPEGNIEEIIASQFKLGMRGTFGNKLERDGLLLESILNPQKNFKNLINAEGVTSDFVNGPWKKKDLLGATIHFLMELRGNYQLKSHIGFFEKLFAGRYGVESPNSNSLFQDIQFGLPKIKDGTAINKLSGLKNFFKSHNPQKKIKKNLLLYYLCQENTYIDDVFSGGKNVTMVKKEMEKAKTGDCPKTQEAASYYRDFLVLFEKKFQKLREKVNHLKNAPLSSSNDRIFENPKDEIMVKKVIKFLEISSFNLCAAYIYFLQSHGIKFHGKINNRDLISLQTFASEKKRNTNTDVETLYNFLEEQTIAQKKPMHFAKIDFLMLFILRPDWLMKQHVLLKYFTYFHSQKFEFFKFDTMDSDENYLRYLVHGQGHHNASVDGENEDVAVETPLDIFVRILDKKSPENINLLKILSLMEGNFHYKAVDDSNLSINNCLDEKIYESGMTKNHDNYIIGDQEKSQKHGGLIHPNMRKVTKYDFQHINNYQNEPILYKCVQNYSNSFSLIQENPLMFTAGFTNVLLNHHMDLFVKLLHYSFHRNNEGITSFGWDNKHFNFQNIEVQNQIESLSHLIAVVLNHCLSIHARHFPQWEELIDFNTFFKDESEKEEFLKYYGQDGDAKKTLCVIMYLLSYFQETQQLNYWNRIKAMASMSNYQKKSISTLLEQTFSNLTNFSIIQKVLQKLKTLEPEKSSYYDPQTRIELNNLSIKEKDPHCKHFMDKAMDYQQEPLNSFSLGFEFFKHIANHNPRLNNKLIFILLWEREKKRKQNPQVSAVGSIVNKYLWIDLFEYANIIPINYLTLGEKIEFINKRIKNVEFFYKKFNRENKNI